MCSLVVWCLVGGVDVGSGALLQGISAQLCFGIIATASTGVEVRVVVVARVRSCCCRHAGVFSSIGFDEVVVTCACGRCEVCFARVLSWWFYGSVKFGRCFRDFKYCIGFKFAGTSEKQVRLRMGFV